MENSQCERQPMYGGLFVSDYSRGQCIEFAKCFSIAVWGQFNFFCHVLQGRDWYISYQSCVMNKLLVEYNKNSLPCSTLMITVNKAKTDCMASSNLKVIIEDNEFALDWWTQTNSYPFIMDMGSMFKKPLSGGEEAMGPVYFDHMVSMKQLINTAKNDGIREIGGELLYMGFH